MDSWCVVPCKSTLCLSVQCTVAEQTVLFGKQINDDDD